MSGSSLTIRSVLLLVAVAGACVIFAWICLIHLGSVGAEDSQTSALLALRIVTATITTFTALLLSRSSLAAASQKRWVLQLAALLQLALAFVGLTLVPLLALGIWNGYIDFPAHPLMPGFLWFLLPMAAVVFCLARQPGSKR
jgi:hypothetical protein